MENVISTKKTVQEFLEQYQSEVYETTIDFQNYSIPISLFISFFDLTNPEFNNLCSNHNITTINDIPKEHFIYAACEFIKTRKILETFNIPQNISIRYQELLTQQKIDFEALNQYLITSDTLHTKISINDSLRTKILSEMSQNMSILEKSIYIYIKMCKLFTYDDEYIAAKKQEFIFEKHKDLNYISKITPENNRIVCFEFNIIYTKLQEELGIHFKSNYKDADTEMILTCNETDINTAEWQNIYYYVNSKNQIMQVSKEFLIEKFQNKEFDYLEEQDRIPGL